MIYIIYLILAIISSASMAIVLKIFRRQQGNRYGILLGNYLTCTALAACFLPADGSGTPLDLSTLFCGLIAGFFFVAGLVGMQSSIRINGAILTSAFAKMGLVIPLAVSILFLKETPTLVQLLGILLILAAIWIICMDKQTPAPDSASSVRPLLLLLVLLVCGGGDAMAKIFEHVGPSGMDGMYFLILFSTATLLTTGLAIREYHKNGSKLLVRELLTGILAGVPNYFSSFLLLKALQGLPAFVVYPGFSTGSLALITIVSLFLFKEKPGRRKWIGLAVIAAALILLAV